MMQFKTSSQVELLGFEDVGSSKKFLFSYAIKTSFKKKNKHSIVERLNVFQLLSVYIIGSVCSEKT